MRSAFRNGWGRIKVWNAALENSLAGDLLGVISLAVMICIGVFFAGVLS
ncbi:MAG: hypothetical protein JKX71_07985 [Amylibacter sp.]|nr:hypothetical protein [Amylibacter sp.]